MVVYRAKNVRIVSMSQYLWTWLYIYSLAAGQCDVSASPFSGEWDREKNSRECAFSSSWRTDPPPLPRSESKSSEPIQGATSTLLEESPSSKACPPCGSEDWGCALLWLRESDGPHIAGDSLHACWIVRLLGDLCTKPQTCCRCESIHAAVPAAAENPWS